MVKLTQKDIISVMEKWSVLLQQPRTRDEVDIVDFELQAITAQLKKQAAAITAVRRATGALGGWPKGKPRKSAPGTLSVSSRKARATAEGGPV